LRRPTRPGLRKCFGLTLPGGGLICRR